MGRSMGSVFSDLYATGHSSRFVLSSYSSEGILHLNLSAFHILGGGWWLALCWNLLTQSKLLKKPYK